MKIINKQNLIDSLIWISVSYFNIVLNKEVTKLSEHTTLNKTKYYISPVEKSSDYVFVLEVVDDKKVVSCQKYDELYFEAE